MGFPQTHPALARALASRNYDEPTPVQSAVLAPEAAARDLLVSARTGSGKTVAYGLAVAPDLLPGDAETFPPPGPPLALVVAPTRELALQVQRELGWLYAGAGAVVAACVGGMDPRAEARRLASGCHLAVGTPGRLRDHLERGNFDPASLRAAVLDEADEMLDLGFREDLEAILQATPPGRRTLLFSATLPKPIVALARAYQRDALRLEIRGEEGGHADIDYRAVRIAPHETEHAVVNLLRFHDAPTAMVFCNTRESVRRLGAALTERGFAAVVLSGELSQHERNTAMQALRDGRARVCVATDVAARGIDLPNTGLVIHADLPNDPAVLQHRSGRTGRAGRKGVSALLVPLSRRRRAESLLLAARIGFGWDPAPTADSVRLLDAERMAADPLVTEEPSEEELALGRGLLAGRTPEQLAAVLARLYRSRLPAPEEVYDPGPVPAQAERRERRPREGDPPPRAGFERGGRSLWFRLDIGRRNDADPRWLLPMICRRGKLTRGDVGAIRIFERETKFEVAEAAAAKLVAAARNNGADDIRLDLIGPDGRAEPARAERGGPKRPPGKPRHPRP